MSAKTTNYTSYGARLLLIMLSLAALCGALAMRGAAAGGESGPSAAGGGGSRADVAYGKSPLSFEPNVGQADARVKFISRGRGYGLFLSPNEAVFALAKPAWGADGAGRDKGARGDAGGAAVLRMRLAGADAGARAEAQDALPGRVNYFVGSDYSKWRANVPTYKSVLFRGVYPGVDVVYYGNQRELEYDFRLAPGADPSKIKLSFEGAETVSADDGGNLVLRLKDGEVKQHRPVIYQEIDGARREVAGRYVLKGREVGFRVGDYDRGAPLVIDPVLVYSTYLGGGSSEAAQDVAVDAYGSAYVTGWTLSTDFPFPVSVGAYQTASAGHYDAFVTKFDHAGALVYSTYLGGSAGDMVGNFSSTFDPATSDRHGGAIFVDASGNAYVTGSTYSADFPVTPGALRTTPAGGDAFVAKLNSAGSALVYSTYLGGSGEEDGAGIAVDAAGNAYVAGNTRSADFPVTPGAFQSAYRGDYSDAFVAKLNPAGTALVYATYLGGTSSDYSRGLAIDSAGGAYVVGETRSADFPVTPGSVQPAYGGDDEGRSSVGDAFVARLNASGTGLVYSTFLGGGMGEEGRAVAVDAAGNAYVTGLTQSINFPTTPGSFQPVRIKFSSAFVSKLNPAGTGLVYSTYLGGTAGDGGSSGGNAIAVDSDGNAYVAGATTDIYFPRLNAVQGVGGSRDAFVTKLDEDGAALIFSTLLGGSGNESAYGVAIDPSRDIYAAGVTTSLNYPVLNPFQSARNGQKDAFVAKISVGDSKPAHTPKPTPTPTPLPADGLISGQVVTAEGAPLSGVTVRLSGYRTGTALTDGAGNYSFANLPTGANYTVTPSRTNYMFSPYAHSVNGLTGARTANFVATPVSLVISGHITDDLNRGLADVTVTLTGTRTQTVVTDAYGSYMFMVPAEGSYTVTPSKALHRFTPASRQYSNLSADQWYVHFKGTLLPAGLP